MANPNGAGNAAMYAATGALNGMPAAGHYSDMQTLMQNMENLSGWLQQNREDFYRVQEGLELVERRSVCFPHSSTAFAYCMKDFGIGRSMAMLRNATAYEKREWTWLCFCFCIMTHWLLNTRRRGECGKESRFSDTFSRRLDTHQAVRRCRRSMETLHHVRLSNLSLLFV